MCRIKILFLVVCMSINFQLLAQDQPASAFSIQDCIEYASGSNSNIKIAKYDEAIGVRQIREVKARALPQINVNGNFENRLKIPLLIIPGASSFPGGGGGEGIRMGYKYNSNLTGEATQMLFDPSFGIGLKAAKQSNIFYKQSSQKIDEQVAFNIANAYYSVIVSQKQLQLLETNMVGTNALLRTTQLQFENGLAKEVDVKRLMVNRRNLESQIKQSQLNLEQSLNNLKFQMGMPVDQSLALSDTAMDASKEKMPELDNTETSFENRIDYKLAKTTVALRELDHRNVLRGYYPTLTAFGNYGYQGQGPDFALWKTANNNWVDFTTASVGVRLRIPIFDGLQKTFRAQQLKIQTLQSQENVVLSKQTIQLELSNATAQYKNSLERVNYEEENVKLAEDVYRITQLEFREGVSTSTDVVEAETSLRQSQNNYTQSLLNLYTSRLSLEKAKGNILNYLNSK